MEDLLKSKQIAVAFLLNEDKEVLSLQKKLTSKFLPGFLVPIGGHIEDSEFKEPEKACLREIEEETGLKGEWISHLKL